MCFRVADIVHLQTGDTNKKDSKIQCRFSQLYLNSVMMHAFFYPAVVVMDKDIIIDFNLELNYSLANILNGVCLNTLNHRPVRCKPKSTYEISELNG